MRLSVSAIAWTAGEDAAIAEVLAAEGIDAVDLVPARCAGRPGRIAAVDVERTRRWWADRGMEVTGLQALLFGTTGYNLFGPPAVREAMLDHLAEACGIGALLGATRLAFGAPRNRDRTGLDDGAALAAAVGFFRRLGDRAAQSGVVVCLEPSPARYGANFMLDTAGAAAIIEAVAHPAIRLQFDTGALAINGEDAEAVLARHARLVGHVHLSEPGLVTLGDGGVDHAAAARAIGRHLPGHVAAIEMAASATESHADAVRRAVRLARRHYGA